MSTHTLYKLVGASYAGVPFPAPRHTWTFGEIKQAWAFNHPYRLRDDGERLVIEGRDERQEWELAI